MMSKLTWKDFQPPKKSVSKPLPKYVLLPPPHTTTGSVHPLYHKYYVRSTPIKSPYRGNPIFDRKNYDLFSSSIKSELSKVVLLTRVDVIYKESKHVLFEEDNEISIGIHEHNRYYAFRFKWEYCFGGTVLSTRIEKGSMGMSEPYHRDLICYKKSGEVHVLHAPHREEERYVLAIDRGIKEATTPVSIRFIRDLEGEV